MKGGTVVVGVLASYPGLLEGGGGEKIGSCTHMHQIFLEFQGNRILSCVWPGLVHNRMGVVYESLYTLLLEMAIVLLLLFVLEISRNVLAYQETV